MPQSKVKNADKVNARQFRRLSEYIRKSSSTLTRAVSDAALANMTGVGNRGVNGKYSATDTLTQREQKRVEQITNLTPVQRCALIGQATFYGALYNEINRYLLPGKRLELQRVRRDSELKADSQGASLARNKYQITILYNSGKRMSYNRFPHRLEYRDPNRSRDSDPIHWGASRKFKRYAIVSVNIFGQNKTAGRKGSEIEGIGYEPIGFRPKSGASKSRYRVFKRVGYPRRRNPDRVTTQHRFPVYTEFLKESQRMEPIRKRIIEDCQSFLKSYAKRHGEILAELARRS